MALTPVIWHNPRCGTSRKTLALLEERGITPQVRLYLADPPDAAELRALLRKLGLPARALVRTKESVWATLGLGIDAPDEEVIASLAAHPILIERPVVIHGDSAAIGRPPEAVLALF